MLIKIYQADKDSRVKASKLAIMLFFAIFAKMLLERQLLTFLHIILLLHQSTVTPNILLAQVLRNALNCMLVEDSPSFPLSFIKVERIDHYPIQDDLLDLIINGLLFHTLEAFSLHKLIILGLEVMLVFFWHSRRGKQIEEHCKNRSHCVYQFFSALDAFGFVMIDDVLDLMLQIAAKVVVVKIISAQRIGHLR